MEGVLKWTILRDSIFDRKAGILLLLGAGLAIREIFASFTGHPFDFEPWLRLGYYTSLGHDPYTETNPISELSMPGAVRMTWIGYPPTWAFFQAALYRGYSLLGVNNRFLYYFIVKQPMIIGDIVAGSLLYEILKEQVNRRAGTLALAFWMFCPYTIIISAMWGMFDQIILALALISILFVLETKKSALVEAVGFLLKVIPLIYLPLLAFSQKSRKKVAEYLLVAIGASVFFSLAPYLLFSSWNVNSMIGVGVDVSGKIADSMSPWTFLNAFTQSTGLSAGQLIVIKLLGYIWVPAVLIGSYFCIKFVRRNPDDILATRKNLFISSLFVTLIFFLTKSAINEQYVIYFLGFGLVDYYAFNSKIRRRLFHGIWISSLAFLVANYSFLARFFEPLSTAYLDLSTNLTQGSVGILRSDVMDIASFVFSTLCLFYFWSLYSEMKITTIKERQLPLVVPQ
jgi:hypothetical protein